MSAPKGWSTQEKDDRLKSEFATIEPVRELQHGMSVVAHEFVELIGTDATEAASTAYSIVATGHAAKKGDVIRFTSGTYSGREIKVADTSANLITFAETLDTALAVAVTFQILRHRYPTVNASGEVITATTINPSSTRFDLNGVSTKVSKDTAVPANSVPLPVEITGASGPINITAGDLNVQLSDQGANFDITRIGDGSNYQTFTASNEAKVSVTQPLPSGTNILGSVIDVSGTVSLPTGASTEATISSINGKTPALGQALEAASVPVVLTAAQVATLTPLSTVSAIQSGTWNVNNVSGTVSLPTGAASSANQINKSQFTQITDGTDDALITAAGELNVLATAQPGVDIGDVTINNVSLVVTSTDLDIRDLTSVTDSVSAVQSGTWNVNNVSGTVSLPTGASTSANQSTGNGSLSSIDGKTPALGQALAAASVPVVLTAAQITALTPVTTVTVTQATGTNLHAVIDSGTVSATQSGVWTVASVEAGFSASGFVRNDYTSGPVTTAAYVTLIASTSAAAKEIEIFDSSGQTLKLAVGAAASEVDQILVFPGGNGRVKLAIPAGTRLSIKAVSASASVGEIAINLYG